MTSQADREKTEKILADIIDKIHSSTDFALLSEYRRIFKKNVSLFRRSWTAAWLLMHFDSNKLDEASGGAAGNVAAGSAVGGAVGGSKKLFVSIGKNRRLHSKELKSLIISKTAANEDDILNIRILDNYSFIQVKENKAEEIIKALNGILFHGRTLTVNYAKNSV